MTPQVFRGPTMKDAQRAAFATLGHNAVVLTTRKVRREGIAGMLGGFDIEIAATVPNEPAPPAPLPAPQRRTGPFASAVYDAPKPAPQPPVQTAALDVARLRSELRGELRSVKSALMRPANIPAEILAELSQLRTAISELGPSSRPHDWIDDMLHARGIEGPAAAAMTRLLRSSENEEELTADERFRDALADVVRVSPWPLTHDDRRVVALVGPSGVGKTTTAAKLAARASGDGRSVMLISCDGFRVGAIMQLRRFAQLLDVTFMAVRTAEELTQTIASASADLVIVDSSGRTPIPSVPESAVAAQFEGRAREVLLCMPAATRSVDAARVTAQFASVDPTGIVITKLDETDTPSGLAHAVAAANLPLSVLCAGQRVPEDVAPATMGAVLDALAGARGEASRKAA